MKLKEDKKYQRILLKRKKKIAEKLKESKKEKKKFVLSTERDYEILSKIKELKKKKLSKNEKDLLKLIESQLELDWRKHLIKKLNETLKRKKLIKFLALS